MNGSARPYEALTRGVLADRVAVITGGSGLLGSAIARALLDAGATVALLARNEDRLRDAVADLPPERSMIVSADVTDEFQLTQARSRIIERFGRVDIVVVGAGLMVGAPFEDAVPNEWFQMIDVNLRGLLSSSQTFAADLVTTAERQRPADLVFIGALASHVAFPHFAVFTAVSAAIAQLARTLRLEYGRRGLRVHNIEPGYLSTHFGRNLHDETAQADLARLDEQITAPMTPEDLGAIVTVTVALPRGINVAEMVVLPTEQG